jgi:hypothetical protein
MAPIKPTSHTGQAGPASPTGSAKPTKPTNPANPAKPKDTAITRRSILAGAGILVAALAAQALITLFGALHKGRAARITDADGVLHEIPLNTNGRTEITTALGTNVIEVADGQIRIVDATCANKDCVRQGAIGSAGQTIVCLPNRLVIRIEDGDGNEDGGADDTDKDGRPAIDTISG